jgi:sarcosine oxidase delta subunit
MSAPTDGNDHTGHSDHPDLTGVAGEMRAAWRAEQEAATADAAEQWRHGRGLADWLCERMHAGDQIAVTVAVQSFAGLVEEVGDDLLGLRCVFGRVEIHVGAGIAISFELVEHATRGGTRATSRRAFRDALLARDAQAGVRVGTLQQPEGIDGTLRVSRDFVAVVTRAGTETLVPIDQVAWVTTARP